MTAIEAFDYLGSLLTQNPLVLSGEGIFLYIERQTDPGEFIAVVLKTTDANKAREYYILGKSGVMEMFFEYPPIIKIPPAPANFPEHLTSRERNEWNRAKAEKVVEFVKSLQV